MLSEVEEEVYVPPVKMSVSKLARDGRVILKFNQDMIVPKFI